MPRLQSLHIYPIKSLGGIAVPEAVAEARGLQYDRRFMLVDPAGQFITQRTQHQMALIDVAIQQEHLLVWHRHHPDDVLTVPLAPEADTLIPLPVHIWADENVAAVAISDAADRWFSAALQTPCRLVYMPDTSRRPVERPYARQDEVVSFADGYPYLVIGQASLDELNQRLPEPITMQRFRPNLVFDTAEPHEEDSYDELRVGPLTFFGVKPCARCILTTVDPDTGQKGKEPIRTLATYRRWNHKILFGQNLLPGGGLGNRIRVGDLVEVISRREPKLSYNPA